MGLFKRRRNEDAAIDDGLDSDDSVDAVNDDDAAGTADPAPAGTGRPQGPWDEADAPDDGLQRLDLGGLRVPVPAETEVRVEMSPQGQVVAATLVRGASAMQVSAFAAPRSDGIWVEVREEISTALREGGGQAQEGEGPLGTELVATVPTEVPGQGRTLMPARFLGVDGPRWFVRALLTGPAASEPGADAELLAALRGIVVVRGSDPMAVRDALALALPKDVAEAAAKAEQEQAQESAQQSAPAARPAPGVPARGPEITEIR
jgi:hypothetical protein